MPGSGNNHTCLSLSILVLLGLDLGLVVSSLETENLGLPLAFKAPERAVETHSHGLFCCFIKLAKVIYFKPIS